MAFSLARYLVEDAADLSLAAAWDADRRVAGHPGLTRHRIGVQVNEARLYHDPDREAADEENTAAHRYLHVHHGLGNGEISQVEMRLDTPDAEAFDQTVNDLAHALAALGHDGDRGQRRAAAVG